MTNERATVGCDWGDDVADWLRREMRADGAPAEGRPDGRADARKAGAVTPPRHDAGRRGAPPFRAGPSLGFFLAAFGLGIALSAWDRPS